MSISLQNLMLLDHDSLVQPLDSCMSGFKQLKECNRVTFETKMDLDHGSVLTVHPKMQKMGLVVWLDRAKVIEYMDREAAQGVEDDHEGPLRSLQLAIAEVKKVGAHKSLLWGVDIDTVQDNLNALFGEVE